MCCSQIYKDKIKTFIFYCLIYLTVFLFFEKLAYRINKEFYGGNLIIITITSICSIFYYKLKQSDYLYIYMIIQIILIVDYNINWLSVDYGHGLLLRNDMVTIYNIILLFYILKRNKLPKWIITHKRLSIAITTITGILCLFYGDKIDLVSILGNNIPTILYLCLAYILIRLFIKSVKERDFVDTLFILNLIIVMLLRKIIVFILSCMQITYIYEDYNKQIFFVAFFILFIGLCVEFNQLLTTNMKLNNEVDNMSNNIEIIKDMKMKQSHYFTNLAHELKTPLNIIFSCIQFLDTKSKEEISDYYYKYNNTLKQNCYRMIRLINNLIDVKKMNTDNYKLEFHNYDIVSLIEEITISVIPYVSNNNIEIIFDTYVEELQIKCDAEKIERIILNLLSNAIKYTPNNGKIMVVIDRNDKNVIIKVIDTGTGVPKDKQESIFEAFVQGDTSLARLKEGSGIGLTLSKLMVELHNGKIFVEKSSPKGTTITVELPIVTLDKTSSMNRSYDLNSNNIIDKINIEFSDIYDIQ